MFASSFEVESCFEVELDSRVWCVCTKLNSRKLRIKSRLIRTPFRVRQVVSRVLLYAFLLSPTRRMKGVYTAKATQLRASCAFMI